MANRELKGIQKYLKHDNKLFLDALIVTFDNAERYKKGTLSKEAWLALKDLFRDPNIKTFTDHINQTYREFLELAKAGKIDAEEYNLVQEQIKDCNKMFKDCVDELNRERSANKNNKKYFALHQIKTDDNELILK